MRENQNDYIPEEESEVGMPSEADVDGTAEEELDGFAVEAEPNEALAREEDGFPVIEGEEYGDEEKEENQTAVERPVLQNLDDFLSKMEKAAILRYINEKIADGSFDRELGTHVGNGFISDRNLHLMWANYWLQNFTDIIADLQYSVTVSGETFKIYVSIWCNLEGTYTSEIRDMGSIEDLPDRTLTKLDRNMVSVLSNDEIEVMAERIWEEYDKNALITGEGLNPFNLMDRLHLGRMELPLYKEKARSILFFEEDEVKVGGVAFLPEEDDRDNQIGFKEEDNKYNLETIPPNTIVLNTNVRDYDGHYLPSYHEIAHWVKDRAFFFLQKLISTDTGDIPRKKVKEDKKKTPPDGLALLEHYATRLGYALMLPRCIILDELPKIIKEFYKNNKSDYVNAGIMYEYVIWALSKKNKVPECRVKTRLLQLGYVEARGARNWADGRWIQPFGFSDRYTDIQNTTYVIGKDAVRQLYKKDKRFRKLMESGDYAHVDGHIVLNHPSFIKMNDKGEARLTKWARSHIDECCLRFTLTYTRQNGFATYKFGRLNCDEAYNRHYRHFIDRQGIMSDEEFNKRKKELITTIKNLPFTEALKELMDYGTDKSWRFTEETLARLSHVSVETIKNYRNKRRCPKHVDQDILLALCIGMNLPPYLSKVLFAKVGIDISETGEIPHFGEILTLRFMDTIEEVQEYLRKNNYPELAISEDVA